MYIDKTVCTHLENDLTNLSLYICIYIVIVFFMFVISTGVFRRLMHTEMCIGLDIGVGLHHAAKFILHIL